MLSEAVTLCIAVMMLSEVVDAVRNHQSRQEPNDAVKGRGDAVMKQSSCILP